MRISAADINRRIRKLENMKYGNRKVTTEDGTFDSVKEYSRWQELKMLERAGEIYDLQRQVPFVLIPAQKGEDGRVIERAVKYIADFTYRSRKDNRLTVEDTKGLKTPEYIIKRKLALYRLGIRIVEI